MAEKHAEHRRSIGEAEAAAEVSFSSCPGWLFVRWRWGSGLCPGCFTGVVACRRPASISLYLSLLSPAAVPQQLALSLSRSQQQAEAEASLLAHFLLLLRFVLVIFFFLITLRPSHSIDRLALVYE